MPTHSLCSDCCASETGLDIVPSPSLTPNRTPEAFNGVLGKHMFIGVPSVTRIQSTCRSPAHGTRQCYGGRKNILHYFQFGSTLDAPPGSTECPPDIGLPARGRKKHSSGDVVLWAACLDSGNSHEVITKSGAHKVCTPRSPVCYSL